MRTVQSELEAAWGRASDLAERFVFAGRTDAGVNAAGQVASVSSASDLAPQQSLVRLRGELPSDIAVLSMEPAPEGFDARSDACWRSYRYAVSTEDGRQQAAGMDVQRMDRAARLLQGEQDFAAFSSSGPLGPRGSTRRVLDTRVDGCGASKSLTVTLVADAFLRQMVRRIVSALLIVGSGRLTEAEISRALGLRDRSLLPGPAPARRLTLLEVGYREYSI